MNSLDHAMRVLELLDKNWPVLRVGEVSRELDLPKSTVSRLMRAMGDHELLERQPDGQGYMPGRRALVLANLYLARHTLLDLIDTAIDRLVAEFKFVGYAAAPAGADIVILRVKLGSYPLRLVQDVGMRIPAYRTAVGRTFLARHSNDAAATMVKERETSADRKTISAEMEKIRRSGVATIESAIIPGIAAVGAALHDPGRGETLGFALSYPMSATDEHVRRTMLQRVREEAHRIGERLGDPPWLGRGPAPHWACNEDSVRHSTKRQSVKQLGKVSAY